MGGRASLSTYRDGLNEAIRGSLSSASTYRDGLNEAIRGSLSSASTYRDGLNEAIRGNRRPETGYGAPTVTTSEGLILDHGTRSQRIFSLTTSFLCPHPNRNT